MRYDDFDDYKTSRAPTGSPRKGASSRSRDYSRDRDYRSDYDRGYDRDYDRYDRGYDRDYDRGYDRGYDREYGYRGDRYDAGRSSGQRGSDFDLSGWARTSPRWEERDRKKRSGGGSSSRSSGASSRNNASRTAQRSSTSSSRSNNERSNNERYRQERSGSGGARRASSSSRQPARNSGRRTPAKQQRSFNWILAVLGLVLIVVAVLIIKNMFGGGNRGYDIEFSTKTIVLGETAEANITGIPEGEKPTITWSSNDNNVVSASASEDGKTCSLTAKSEGQATIAATVDGETVSGTVMVVKVAPGVVKINMNETETTIQSGETYTLKATVVMEKDDMTPAKIKWTSNDASVARVSEEGVVTARDVGETIIKGTAGEKTVEFIITVVENKSVAPHDGTQTTGQEPEAGAEIDGGTEPTDKTTGKPAGTTTDQNQTGTGSGGTTGETDGAAGNTDPGSTATGDNPVAG